MTGTQPVRNQESAPSTINTVYGLGEWLLARCTRLNRSLNTNTVKLRELLRERGWRMVWSPEEQELCWVKTFPDAATQYLTEQEAYWFEQDHARDFLNNTPAPFIPGPDQPPFADPPTEP